MDQAPQAPWQAIAESLAGLTFQTSALQPCESEAKLSSRTNTPKSFTLLLALPPEIRLLVYEQYFAKNIIDRSTRVIPGSRPRQADHAAALLFTCRQIYLEALPVLYDIAALTIDLSPDYNSNGKDYAYWLDNFMDPGCTLKGNREQLHKFRNIHLTLTKPTVQLFGLSLTLSYAGGKWWQNVAPIYTTTASFFADMTMAINIGDITSTSPRRESLARHVKRPHFYARGWHDLTSRSDFTAAELKARGKGDRLLQVPAWGRELIARTNLIQLVGWKSGSLGRELRVENSDRSRTEVIRSDKLPDLVKSARGVVAEGKEKDVWLVIGAKKKSD